MPYEISFSTKVGSKYTFDLLGFFCIYLKTDLYLFIYVFFVCDVSY